jgi:hypothetical protein
MAIQSISGNTPEGTEALQVTPLPYPLSIAPPSPLCKRKTLSESEEGLEQISMSARV